MKINNIYIRSFICSVCSAYFYPFMNEKSKVNCLESNKYYDEISQNNFNKINMRISEMKSFNDLFGEKNKSVILEESNTNNEDKKKKFYLKINKNLIRNYQAKKHVKLTSKYLHQVKVFFRNYLNYYQFLFYNDSLCLEDDKCQDLFDIDLNSVINIMRGLNDLKLSLSNKLECQIVSHLFSEVDELILRLQSYMVIINKHKNVLSQENYEYIINQAKHNITNEDALQYIKFLSKRILLNIFSKDTNFYYTDTLLEINTKNFEEISQMKLDNINYENKYDKDIIFLNGLNVTLIPVIKSLDQYNENLESFK